MPPHYIYIHLAMKRQRKTSSLPRLVSYLGCVLLGFVISKFYSLVPPRPTTTYVDVDQDPIDDSIYLTGFPPKALTVQELRLCDVESNFHLKDGGSTMTR